MTGLILRQQGKPNPNIKRGLKSLKIPNNIKNLIQKSYNGFTILSNTTPFNELFSDMDFGAVDVYLITNLSPYEKIITFAGKFKWQNNQIEPLDGDSYSNNLKVFAYKKLLSNYLSIITDDF